MMESVEAARPAYCRPDAYLAFASSVPAAGTAEGLFRAAWAISQHELPDAQLTAGEAAVGQLVEAVRRRVRSQSPDALLAHLHNVLFDELEFRGNVEHYYLAANSYLPEVLRTRRGLPITLTLLYRRVAAGLGLVVHGVNAPGHFLAVVEIDGPARRESMYVDPFFGGGLLTGEEVFARIAQATGQVIPPSALQLTHATPTQWLARMLHNLQAVFAAAGRDRDVYAMQELHELL